MTGMMPQDYLSGSNLLQYVKRLQIDRIMSSSTIDLTQRHPQKPEHISSPLLKDFNCVTGAVPAGGLDPEHFDWQAAWYPIHYIEDLDKSKLTPFTLLDQDLVIWWDRIAETWRVFANQCPHRLAPLSEGRVDQNGWLECPYHGWAFSGEGNCERIPQQVDGRTAETSQRACVPSLPTTVQQGLLFVFPGPPESAAHTPVPLIGPLEESPEAWVCLSTFRDLPYDALTLMENVLDPSHLPYTHHRSVGNRANAGPVELEVDQFGRQGFFGVWEEGPRQGQLGRQTTHFVAPGLMWHDLTSKQFGRTVTAVYATPMRKGECRLFARFPFQFAAKIPEMVIKLTPRWYSHIGQNAILEDDQIFLHHQERMLERSQHHDNVAKAFYLPTRADRFVMALHRWLKQYNAYPFPNQLLPPALSRSQLLDRYHSHTQHCASCRAALTAIQRLKLGVKSITLLIWICIPLVTLGLGHTGLLALGVTTPLALLCGTVWIGLAQLERRFYDGRDLPPRNQPEKR